MQGYQQKILRLVWPEGDERHGLVVRVMRMSIDDMLAVAGLESGTDASNATERLISLVQRTARMLVSWNLEVPKRADDGTIVLGDDGDPVMEAVPANAAGLRRADQTLLNAILSAAVTAVAGVSPPLNQPSADGGQSLAESIPMEPLSESPPPSSEPD